MPRAIRVPVPVVERVDDTKHMEVEEPAAQQGGESEPVVMSLWNQRIEKLEQSIEKLAERFEKQEELLKAIFDQLPPASRASSSAPLGGQQ